MINSVIIFFQGIVKMKLVKQVKYGICRFLFNLMSMTAISSAKDALTLTSSKSALCLGEYRNFRKIINRLLRTNH